MSQLKRCKRLFNWRRRVRIEHTHRGIATAQTGFEVRAAHQDRSASSCALTDYIISTALCQIALKPRCC